MRPSDLLRWEDLAWRYIHLSRRYKADFYNESAATMNNAQTGDGSGPAPAVSRDERKFLAYVPNARLTAFHRRSPWLMLPYAFHELGFDSVLFCGRLEGQRPTGIRVVESGLVVDSAPGGELLRSTFEPFIALREILHYRPNLIFFGPIRSSLVTFLPLISAYRGLSRLLGWSTLRIILKTDWSLDYTGLNRLAAFATNLALVVSTHVFDVVSIETYCGVEKARRLPMIKRERLARIPVGFPRGLMAEHNFDDQRRGPTILCVARIDRMKGQDVLLRAFASLVKTYPSWSVHLVGPLCDSDFKKELEDYVIAEGLSGRVAYLGFLDDSKLEEEFASASILCLPSVRSENAGQVKYEAAASGLPVVTTDVPCRKDAEEMGCLVAVAGSATDLAEKLGMLMRDEAERARISKGMRNRLISYLDVARTYLAAIGQ